MNLQPSSTESDTDAPTPGEAAVERLLLHRRDVCYQGFARSDGLWDVEGSLLDTRGVPMQRPDRPPLAPGDPVHRMTVTATLDDDLCVVAIVGTMLATPFGECQDARSPLQRLVGQQMRRGWRRAIETAMGGTGGCTHLRELLVNMATAAIQAIPAYRDEQRLQRGEPTPQDGAPPHFIGGCMTWRRDGPVVKRAFPQFFVEDKTPEPRP